VDSVFPGRQAGPDVQAIRDGYRSPEEIDDGPDTHPSGRLRALIPEYDKVRDGSLVTQRIGLSRLRSECPHFGDWLTRLERLTHGYGEGAWK